MLQMARAKEPVKESFDLSCLVREVLERMGSDTGVQLDLVSSHDPFMIHS